MRIRQVRPEFFADGRVSKLPVDTRLTYIGLWCIADDAGWLPWDVADIGAQLYPYESVRVRERRLTIAGANLVSIGRLIVDEKCHCGHIPTLPDHQRIGGNKSFLYRDRHSEHKSRRVRTNLDKSRTRPPVGSEVVSELTGASARDDDEYRAGLNESFRRQGLPVDS